jgi:hypothetical protein
VALAAATALFNGSPGATATQGQPVIAGQTNTATNETVVQNTNVSVPGCSTPFQNGGLLGCGHTGVRGFGGATGVLGDGGNTGVLGLGATDRASGIGVFGQGFTGLLGTGILNGVEGQTNSAIASGVYGENDGTGFGVAGRANSGTGVLADSTDGIALAVNGKAKFSRSGTARVAGTSGTPRSSITVNNVALTSKSLVLVTPQKNVVGVLVQGVVPNVANSRFTVFLNKNVSVSYPVAWMVIEKP